jgi:dolichyl-phosphate beta-glucosyltransferase
MQTCPLPSRLARRLLESDCDVLQGSRVRLLGKDIERSSLRHYVGRISATLISVVLDLPIYDTQAGAKVFSMRALNSSLFQEPFMSRWLFDCEIFLRARQLGLRVMEEPLERWHARTLDSKVNITSYLYSLRDLLRIRRRYRR